MIELTQEQRRKIYEEEKAKLEKEEKSSIDSLFTLTLIASLVLTFLIFISKHKVQPKIESFRKAYEGLPPSE